MKYTQGQLNDILENLEGAKIDLSGDDLSGLDFKGANLTRANLTRANLTRANLTVANLMGANLTVANLMGANLYGCVGNRKQVMTILTFGEYLVTYTHDRLQIGCKNYPINDWWGFDDKDILEMDGKTALKFWRKNKELIRQIIEQCPAQPTGHAGE